VSSEDTEFRDEEGADAAALRARFPDPDADARLQVPRGAALPEVPEARFTRPSLPQVGPAPEKADKIQRLSADLRSSGAASTVGITLLAGILLGTGLGWAADTFLLHSPPTPWGTIIGFVLGTTAGFIQMIRLANRLNRDE
jgi:F0F1-type ATP synthase assembly protein I